MMAFQSPAKSCPNHCFFCHIRFGKRSAILNPRIRIDRNLAERLHLPECAGSDVSTSAERSEPRVTRSIVGSEDFAQRVTIFGVVLGRVGKVPIWVCTVRGSQSVSTNGKLFGCWRERTRIQPTPVYPATWYRYLIRETTGNNNNYPHSDEASDLLRHLLDKASTKDPSLGVASEWPCCIDNLEASTPSIRSSNVNILYILYMMSFESKMPLQKIFNRWF